MFVLSLGYEIYNQSPYIQQGMVYGDRQKFLSALITLRWEAIENYARQAGIRFHARADLVEDDKIHELIQSEIDKINKCFTLFLKIADYGNKQLLCHSRAPLFVSYGNRPEHDCFCSKRIQDAANCLFYCIRSIWCIR